MLRVSLICGIALSFAAPAWAQEVNVPIPKSGIDFGGMLKPFNVKPSTTQPAKSKAAPAAKPSSSKSGSAFHEAPAIHEGSQPEGAPLASQVSKPVYRRAAAPVTLSPEVVKIPADTASGYCLQAPADYVGTGSANRPAVTAGLPRCEKVAPAGG